MHTTSTGCVPLDRLLDGGLESDAITLVFGEGGSGKTNLALQCAREVAVAGKRVAYVDTEGVSQKRLAQVFDVVPDAERARAEERLLFYTPYSIAQQEKMVKATALLRDVGLIVVDSINMHYRLHIDAPGGEKEARQSLIQQLHHLTMHARQHDIPVLVTGQVYGGEDDTQPFARRVMEHLVKALVRFEKRPDGGRRATVLKHRSIEEGRQARFRIGPHGLEGPDAGAAVRASGTADRAGTHDAPRTPGPSPAHGAAPDDDGERDPAKDSSSAPTGTGFRPAGEASRPAHNPGPPAAPSDLDERGREEARRDADAWGVDRDGADHAQPTDEAPAGDGTREEPHAAGRDDRDDAAHRGAATAVYPAPREEPDAHPAAGIDPDDEGPASSLLTDEERREAEALPGFSPASALGPPEHSEKGAQGR